MRDPKRINKFCAKLAEMWSIVPDWRFGQFITNVLDGFMKDIFVTEDDELLDFIERKFKSMTTPTSPLKLYEDYMAKFNAAKATEDVVQWIRDWFEKNGNSCDAVVGISGGKDSSVVAALCVQALGADRVVGILMPNQTQSDINDSYEICKHLGIRHFVQNINPAYSHITSVVKDQLGIVTDQTMINLAPRLRMATLYAYSQSLNGRVANTCNLSEDYIGYSTRYGDTAGDFAPLKNFTSDEVMAIGDYLELPRHLVHKIPSDGLCGKTDEDNLGFTYKSLNSFIRVGIPESTTDMIKISKLHKQNAFKECLIDRFKYNPVI